MLGNRAGSQRLIQLGERIRQKRKDSHLSQETFAEKAGISVNTVSRIEGGQAGDVRGDFCKAGGSFGHGR
ncbi:MAG: helix-turn-helix domain-containing protein [Lachnospiraceae bacterium]